MKRRQFLAAALLGAALASFAPGGPAVAQSKPLTLVVTDIAGLENLQLEFGAFRDLLSARTGLKFEFVSVSSRTAAVEAMKSGKVDFVVTGPAEYVVFRKRTNAEPVVGWSRPDYFSVIVTVAGRGIHTPADLKGKKLAFGDVGSTSQHLGPAQTLADHGLNLKSDLQILHLNRNVSVEALKKGDLAAVGMNDTHLRSARAKNPDVTFEVIARGRDLPSDILLAGPHVEKATVETVRKTFTTDVKPLIDAILKGEDNQKYKGMVFLASVKDEDYNYVRSMYRTIGFPEYAEFVGN